MRKWLFYPGRMAVNFQKGTLGFLPQDPTDAAKVLKDNPALQDKSAPMKEKLVRLNALHVVRMRGGDSSDNTEVTGEYILQFGSIRKYKGKSFRWLLENDIGYTIYRIRNQQKEQAAGVFMAAGHNKDSLLSFVNYSLGFKDIQSLVNYEEQKPPVIAAAASEDDLLVGFGARANSTWREIWDSRVDGYAPFIFKKSCAPGTKMYKLKMYLQKKQPPPSVSSPTTQTSSSSAPAESMGGYTLLYTQKETHFIIAEDAHLMTII